MLNDLVLISHKFDKGVTIYPIADVHLGAMEHAETEWQDFLKKVETENAYLILAGDLLNNGVRTCKFANPFEETLRPMEAKHRMVEYLEPVKDRILCVVGGNHERRTYKESDQDITYDICAKLNIEHLYRENVAYMKVACGRRKNGAHYTHAYCFAVTHGSGGGIYTGAAVNRDERFGNIVDGLDCLVTGHVHKGFITKPSKIIIDPKSETVKSTSYLVVSCVSWLNYGGYAARGMLLPAQVCDPQKLHLSEKREKKITTSW